MSRPLCSEAAAPHGLRRLMHVDRSRTQAATAQCVGKFSRVILRKDLPSALIKVCVAMQMWKDLSKLIF